MKSVNIEYFALLREEAKRDLETIETSKITLGELYHELKERHSFSLPLEMVQVALNDEFSQFEREFKDGDKVVFIPPVAGG